MSTDNNLTGKEECEPELVDAEHETGAETEEGYVMVGKKRRQRSRKRSSSKDVASKAPAAPADSGGVAGATMAAIFVAIATGGAGDANPDGLKSAPQRRARSRGASVKRQQAPTARAERRAASVGPRRQPTQRMPQPRGNRR